MSGLINLIKSLFSGIFGFIGGLFGGKKAIAGSTPKAKKSNGYFLELDEAKETTVVKAAPADESAEAVTLPNAAQPMTVAKEVVEEAVSQTNGKSTKSSSRKEKLAALAADQNPAAGNGKTAAATPEAPKQPTPAVTKAPVSETAFATKYLIPTNTGTRRRPGANMASYLDMARKINTAS